MLKTRTMRVMLMMMVVEKFKPANQPTNKSATDGPS